MRYSPFGGERVDIGSTEIHDPALRIAILPTLSSIAQSKSGEQNSQLDAHTAASEDADHIYLGMPYYAKGSLKELIELRFLTVREIIRYSIHFLSGLNNIHVKNLIHFDIKPDNILLSESNEALVTDFGLAQAMDLFGMSEVDRAYYKHLPPEYFKTNKHSMLYDIYSSGLTIYRLCNGNKMFYEQFDNIPDKNDLKTAILNGRFPNRDTYKIHIPSKLRKIIKKTLSVDPTNRHQTVLELLNDLSKVDKLLDWVYEESPDTQIWEKEDGEKTITIELKKLVNSRYDLKTFKMVKSSGNTTKVSSGCKKDINDKEAEKIVGDLLESYDS